MNIGIIDADIAGRTVKHRFPNLACMKISGYHKNKGDTVTLITEYIKNLNVTPYATYYKLYDKIYVSKVFTDTYVPYGLLKLSIVEYGGTGFFYSDAPSLPYDIEHSKPDYYLYDDWIKQREREGTVTKNEFIYYKEYSIGFTTRYCNRHCSFCINKHHNKVEIHSPVKEFMEVTEKRNKICLLDDNILAYEQWKKVFDELNSTGVYFEFRQGFDIRNLTEEKIKIMMNSNIRHNNIYFAFDNIKEKDLIIEKLSLWRKSNHINTHMYLLSAYDETNKYTYNFWENDIVNLLERIKICIDFKVYPYIMRFRKYNSAPEPFRGMYIILAGWCNQKSLFSKMSFNEWVNGTQQATEKHSHKKKLYSTKRYLMEYAGKYPDIAYKYFDICYKNSSFINLYNRSKNILTSNLCLPIPKRNNRLTKENQQEFKKNIIVENKNVIDLFKQNRLNNNIETKELYRIFNKSEQKGKTRNYINLYFNYKNMNYIQKECVKNKFNILIIRLNKNIEDVDFIFLNNILNLLTTNGEVYILTMKFKEGYIISTIQQNYPFLKLVESVYDIGCLCFRYVKGNTKGITKIFKNKKIRIMRNFFDIIYYHASKKYKYKNIFIITKHCTKSNTIELAKKYNINTVNLISANNPLEVDKFTNTFIKSNNTLYK